ncbi:glycosyltransferase family 2 protein, partial [bacterium]|nr:glycosyltransferase family 2 protein [bacterium]
MEPIHKNMMKPYLSVIVCTYNRAGLLKQCLLSLCGQTLTSDKFEVIIVDNNSTDSTYQVSSLFTEQYKHFRYVTELNQGLSYCRNTGITEADGEYIAFIDDDAKAESGWAEKIVYSFLNVTPAPSAVGGQILPFYDTKAPRWFKDEYETRSWGEHQTFLQPPRAQHGFSGSNCAVRKNFFKEIGYFNTELGMKGNKLKLGEEADFFCRLYRKHPFFWYDPAVKVHHYTPSWKMKTFYQLKRQYISGKASAYIHQSDISSKKFFKKLY